MINLNVLCEQKKLENLSSKHERGKEVMSFVDEDIKSSFSNSNVNSPLSLRKFKKNDNESSDNNFDNSSYGGVVTCGDLIEDLNLSSDISKSNCKNFDNMVNLRKNSNNSNNDSFCLNDIDISYTSQDSIMNEV